MTQWFIKNNNIDFLSEFKDLNINPIIAKLLSHREVDSLDKAEKFLFGSYDKLYDPSLMKGVKEGAELIESNIKLNNKIRIIGDYDVDGIMSTYILVNSINKLGGIVDYRIPNRLKDGYGINKNMVKQAYEDGIDLIITCDNGISALEEMEYARKLGIKTIITDHHELPYNLKDGKKELLVANADIIINPKNPICTYPYKNLCGAGVAYKLIEYLSHNIFKISLEKVYELMEFVAIATIADVVELMDENRIIVREGLKLVNETENLGLKTLIDVLEIQGKIGVYHIGFIIGPSLNAAGRLDIADKGVELLLSKDPIETKILAEELKSLNDYRKEKTEIGVEKIIEEIENSDIKNDNIIIVYNKEIHESVAGIVAGRVKDKYYKPTIVLTNSRDEGIIKGSARSISEYNMYEALVECKDLILKFGGHPLAAGLSLNLEKLDLFRQELNKNSNLSQEDLIKKYYIDLGLPINYINYDLIEELKLLEPHGIGNPRPLFGAKSLRIEKAFKLGKNKNVLKLMLRSDDNTSIEGMLFNKIDDFDKALIEKYGEEELEKIYNGRNNRVLLDILYSPNINEFLGRVSLQVIIENYRL